MSELWESLGEYTLYSYTRVDVWEPATRFLIDTNSVHEYAHAYMIKSSNYGTYLMCLLQIIKNHSVRVSYYTGNQRDEFQRKIRRLEKILYTLHENMKVVQETIASLIEILYVCYVKGYDEGRKYLWQMGAYLEYVKKYEYIVDKTYLEQSGKYYLEYIKIQNRALYDVLSKKTDRSPEIFWGIRMLLEIGRLALNIEKFDCTEEQWAYPNAFINTQVNSYKYHPDKRFYTISDRILGRASTVWDVEFLSQFEFHIEVDEVKEQLLSLISSSYVANKEDTMRQTDSDRLGSVIEVKHGLVSMKDFESFAFLTSIPSITCQNSINRFYNPQEYIAENIPGSQDISRCKRYLEEKRTIGIVSSGMNSKVYTLRFNKKLENAVSVSPAGITNWDLGEKVSFDMNKYEIDNNISLMCNKEIILYGNYGFEDLIKKLNMLGKRHYVYLTNNLQFVFGFITDLVKESNEKTNATFIKTKDFKNVLVIKCGRSIVFQPMINRHIELIQKDYHLVFGHNIIDQDTESVISNILSCQYEEEAYAVSLRKDKYTAIVPVDKARRLKT